jgi:isochorismate synthase
MNQSLATDTHLSTSLLKLCDAALNQGYALAAWQLPQSQTQRLLISQKTESFKLGDTFESLGTGFVVQPFNRALTGSFLRANLMFSFHNAELLPPQNPTEMHSRVWLNNLKNPEAPGQFYAGALPAPNVTDAQSEYYRLVEQTVKAIQRGYFEKAVPSRCKVVQPNRPLHPVQLFEKMCRVFPHAFVSLISLPEYGTWLGASPEILVAVDNQSVFRTVALAGTKPLHPGMQIKDVAWTQKEIEEQAMVSRYIVNCFKKIRLREFEEHGPRTVEAGHLLHLKTEFTVNLKTVQFPELGSVMLNLLHPTSAVCGMPMEPAWQFLLKHEGYDRSLYTGFLGPVNVDNRSDIYVQLRCIQWSTNQITGYAGCGVTADSKPDSEWKESEIKINSLLNEIL